jgi:co-chaperonin GroES (HSP10)
MKPNLNYILILPDEVETGTSLILPETITIPYSKGTVIEVGDGCYNQTTGELRKVQTRKGDKVYFVPNAGYAMAHDGLECVLIREEEIYTRNGEPINEWIGVEFDHNHNKTVKHGGLELVKSTSWFYEELEGKAMYDVNRDLKDTNPQIATIVTENKSYGLKKGDKVFVHYLQYDTKLEFDGVKYINFNTIFFKINGEDDFEMADGVYLAKRTIIEAKKTESGIYITSEEAKPEPLKIKITHVPRNNVFNVGDIAVTADDFQYEIDVYGEKYVKVTPEWIVGVIE